MDAAADVAKTTCTLFRTEPYTEADAAHRPAGEAHARFPTGPLRHLQLSRLHRRPGGETLEPEANHRRHAEIENAIRDLKYGVGLNHLPSGHFPANAAWLAVQVMAHNLVWYVGMRQTDPTWVEENRGPAWSSHPILIEPEQLPGPIAPASCKEGPTFTQEVPMMPDPLTVGRRAAARLKEAILLALEEYRDQGYLSTIRLAERIGWDAEGMPSPDGRGYGRLE